MTDLIAFVNARLREDESAAHFAFGEHNEAEPEWTEIRSGAIQLGPHEEELITFDAGISRHIVRHDPKSVLADITFKRKLLELYDIAGKDGFGGSEGWVLIRDAIYALAALWSDHEDYNPTWRTQ